MGLPVYEAPSLSTALRHRSGRATAAVYSRGIRARSGREKGRGKGSACVARGKAVRRILARRGPAVEGVGGVRFLRKWRGRFPRCRSTCMSR